MSDTISLPIDRIPPPDQFLYQGKGPWPQPSPSLPHLMPPAVLNVPGDETQLWMTVIGARYGKTRLLYPGIAAKNAVNKLDYKGPDDASFNRIMFESAYLRYLSELSDNDKQYLGELPDIDKQYLRELPDKDRESADASDLETKGLMKYDFSAMDLVDDDEVERTYCTPTVMYIVGDPAGTMKCVAIRVKVKADGSNDYIDVFITPADPAWQLAKIYALQGAAYHILFVVHPALHFPMDTINAITKTVVPWAHPLHKLLIPHTRYTLALNNRVLEDPESVVNNNANGTWYDPLTSNAYYLKRLFAAGYSGYADNDAYPSYNYMEPQLLKLDLNDDAPVYKTTYSKWLTEYFKVFEDFCKVVADVILDKQDEDVYLESIFYVTQWAKYIHVYIPGFPEPEQIIEPDTLARAMAIYMWDVSVAHGADHHSFASKVPVVDRFLRIRVKPPSSKDDYLDESCEIFSGDDLFRSEMADVMFFRATTVKPNLYETLYPFTNKVLANAQIKFKRDLLAVSQRTDLEQFMNLVPAAAADPETAERRYQETIPASIQF